MRYINLHTNDEKIIQFPLRWIINPVCSFELFLKKNYLYGVLGMIPFYNLIIMFKYKEILGRDLESKGYVRIGWIYPDLASTKMSITYNQNFILNKIFILWITLDLFINKIIVLK